MKPIPARFFSSLLPELATRAARATVSRLSMSNPALRSHLLARFSADIGEPGSFLAEPVFEATFGWESAGKTLKDLRGPVLSSAFLDAMAKQKSGHALPDRPYSHQLEAWEILSKKVPQSVIVTSGTGSGKTECFMVPILDQLARQAAQQTAPLEGVQALFLYPLNALIKSQKERLEAWTAPFGGRVRFSLYNGLTPERPLPAHQRSECEVSDRLSLRASPPPILVTNATMLEYMLVRAQDAPIRERSKGQLKWIVLDEAHSYIGSQAAELSLLLRRVLHGFGVHSDDVRFVATSATIGDPHGEAGQKLKQFLTDLAGVPPDRVHVVAGQRSVPPLPVVESFCAAGLEELEAIDVEDPAARYQAAVRSSTARAIRAGFEPGKGQAANPLSRVCAAAVGEKSSYSAEEKHSALRWLDLLTSAVDVSGEHPQPFLPLRLHAFHNVLPGLWACCDRTCGARKGTALDSDEWGFGAVYTEQREACSCGAPVFELRSCNECNESVLWGVQVDTAKEARTRLLQEPDIDEDDFQLESDGPPDETVEGDLDVKAQLEHRRQTTTLLANSKLETTSSVEIEFATRFLNAPGQTQRATLHALEADDNGRLTCPSCGAHHGNGRLMFRAARMGAPFLMMQVVPSLLEYCADGDDPQGMPWRGRRMITFTDSRQGTARAAAALQREAERNCVRSLVYRRVMAGASQKDPDAAAAAQKKLEKYRAFNDPELDDLIADLEATLSKATRPEPIAFGDLAGYLALHEEDIRRWALSYYRDLSPQEFGAESGALELARLFLFREFGRRPKRANTLETLGLVAVNYPKLQLIKSVPPAAKAIPGISLDEWRSLLKVFLDFVVRASSCLEFKPEWRRWTGTKTVSAQFMHPDSKDPATGTKRRWPEARKGAVQHRVVRLLAETSMLDPAKAADQDQLNGILRAAWDALIGVGLLRTASAGSYLALEDLAFSPISNGWLCPVTRGILDNSWRGISPYLPGQKRKAAPVACQAVEIPAWPDLHKSYPADGIERVAAARDWLSNNQGVLQLRALGVWSNLNDRIVEGVRYFRAAEHSAQQSGDRLDSYEKDFRSGKINLLSCSTTMEMGVDIGGISVVAMNNVPPHPANYLQRAGRAGRRSETRSVGLTMCKANPHDQQVFTNPMWPFTTALPAPVISLESPVIVQRHVNAMLLADFLWRQVRGDASLEKLTMEWWALPLDTSSTASRFAAWAKSFDPESATELAAGLSMLLKGSCFDKPVPLTRLAADAADAMDALLKEWSEEVRSIDEQLLKFTGRKDKEPAFRAMEIQRRRLTQEYLLRELATNGFLPGYGFPTNISAFDTLNVDELERLKFRTTEGGREDNRLRRRELPSRDAVTALREYAPGADVVIDGTVFRSSGITLNWHAPASAVGVKEIQSIGRAWRCGACGASGTAGAGEELVRCVACSSELDSASVFTYLQPSGFAVDLYESTHTDVGDMSYVPVQQPWINAVGDWLPLPNPKMGRFRASSQGKVFNRSSGVGGRGYAICLECGRAAPMPAGPDTSAPMAVRDLPKVFQQPHRRLRGAQGGDTSQCAGSQKSYAIKPYVHLGIEETTDVLELQLNHASGIPLTDKVTAYSIAVALRNAVAAALGVDTDEIGCDVKPIRLPDGTVSQSIVLFDHAAAGYCSSVAPRIPELLRDARDRQLTCKANCQTACQHCLSSYDTRFRLPDLDRKQGLDFLSDEWLAELQLPVEYQYFGPSTSWAETQPMVEAITREWDRSGSLELRLFLTGDPSDWDLSAPSFRRTLERWVSHGMVRLVVPESARKVLAPAQLWVLKSIADLSNLTIYTVPVLPAHQVAQVLRPDLAQVWACSEPSMAMPGSDWAQPRLSPLVRGVTSVSSTIGEPWVVAAPLPEEMPPTAGRLELRGALAKTASDLGAVFWTRLGEAARGPLLEGDAPIASVMYRDRYLNAPLPVALLTSVLKALRKLVGERWADPDVVVVTTELPQDGRYQAPSQVFHNWPDQDSRDKAIRQALSSCSQHVDVRVLAKNLASHARTLEIATRDGKKLRLWLDQGFGYWSSPRPNPNSNIRTARSTWFRFDEAPSAQGERISAGGFDIEGQSFPTHVFFEKV